MFEKGDLNKWATILTPALIVWHLLSPFWLDTLKETPPAWPLHKKQVDEEGQGSDLELN